MQTNPKKTDQHSDANLIKRIILKDSGWQIAFTRLFERYQLDIQRRSLGLLGNQADVDDVIQEVFIRFYRFAHQYDGQSSFKTWLMRITENQCYTVLKKGQKQQAQMAHIRALIELEAHTSDIEFSNNEDLKPQMAFIFSQLNPKVRDILWLRYWLDLTLPQIAGVLGVSLSASKMRLIRAQDNCRQMLLNA